MYSLHEGLLFLALFFLPASHKWVSPRANIAHDIILREESHHTVKVVKTSDYDTRFGLF